MSDGDKRQVSGRRPVELLMAVLEGVAALAILLMVLHTVANALMRTWFNSPLTGANEYAASWYLPVVAFVGFVLAQDRGKHIDVDLIVTNLRGRRRQLAAKLAQLTTAAVMALLAWGTWTEAVHSFDIGLTSGVMGVVVWPFVFLAPAAFAALTVQLVLRAFMRVRTTDDTHPEEAGVL